MGSTDSPDKAFTARDGLPPLLFSHTVEGLFVRGVGPSLTPELHTRLAALGLDLSRPLKSAYPLSVWMAGVRLLVETLYPELPRDEAYRRLGDRFLGGYFDTLLGRTVGSLLRLLGPKRTLQRVEQQFRSGNNFSETSITFTGDSSCELWINHTFGDGPGFTTGILERGLSEAGARELSVVPLENAGLGCRYRISWRA